MSVVKCKICLADNQEEQEAMGLLAISGEISWREAVRRLGLSHHASLQNHMKNHYIVAQQREVLDDFDRYVEEAVADLLQQFAVAPPEVKPLLLAAVHNIRELRDTKPSQQHLIASLKAIQEMTGMKQEQRMMLLFAERMFGEVAAPADLPQLPDPNIIDVEPLPTDEDEDNYVSTRSTP